MERVGRLSKNTAALVSSKVATSGLTFILAIIINRNLGPEIAGIYTYAFTLYTIFQVIPDFGLGNISIRDVSQDDSRLRRYFGNVVSLRLLLGALAFTLLMLTNLVTLAVQGSGGLGGEKFWVVFTIAFCLLIEQPLSNSLSENFIALERLGVVALVYLVMGILKVAMSIYVVVSGLGNVLIYLVAVYIITILYSILHLSLAYKRALRGLRAADAPEVAAEGDAASPPPRDAAMEALLADYGQAAGEGEAEGEARAVAQTPQPPPQKEAAGLGPLMVERSMWRYLLGSAWPLAVVAAGVTVYTGMDVPILSWIKGDAEVGLYNAAGMFAKALVFLTLALNMAVLPAVSKVGGKHPQRLGEVWERLIRYALLLVVPLVVMLPTLARPVLLLQKHAYIEAWHVTWLSMAALNFTFMTSVSFPFFIVINKQRTISSVVLLGLPLKAALGVLAISLWGYTGAAVSVLVSEAAVFAILYWRLSRELDHRIDFLAFAWAPALMLGALYALAFVLHGMLAAGRDTFLASAQGALIIAAALAVLYIGLAFATRALSRKGLHELNDLLTV